MTEPQQFTFQTEIKQVLHILSHSLYQNREIAIRELISNASDALNKLRHIQLTEEQYRDDAPLEITLDPNAEQKVLVIRDNGLGLTHDELIQNLGTIAHSGSKEFLNQLSGDAKKDLTLIGQFGVGFYSAFMLADRVEVLTKSYRDETGWVWSSDGTGQFSITPATEPLPRGAQIRLHLKEDLLEFAEPARLKYLVRKYSTFVPHPIKLAGEQLNDQRPIWVEPKTQITDEQYAGFYQWLSHRSEEQPLWHLHLSSDSPIQFHAILFCPAQNFELLGFGRSEHGIALCAKRILVDGDRRDLLPDYLNFLYGLVDSADLPLNVSRETLQDHKLLPKLKKILTKRVLDHLATWADEQPEKYQSFYQQFVPTLRTGIGSDFENRDKIAKLLRFHSTHASGTSDLLTAGLDSATTNAPKVSLDAYLQRLAVGQSQIYYLSGPDLDTLQKHPHLEQFKKRGLEVLLLVDHVDEFALRQLQKYDDKELISIDSAEVKLPDQPDSAATDRPPAPAGLTRLMELFRGALSDQISDVRESSRLVDSPVCLVNAQSTMSARLEQALQQNLKDYPLSKRILEVNPHSALIGRLCALTVDPSRDEFLRDCGRQLYANALMLDGLVPDPTTTTKRIESWISTLAQPGHGPGPDAG